MILPNAIRQTSERTASHQAQRIPTDFPPRMDDRRRDSRHPMDVDQEHRRENPQAVPFAPHQAHPARAASVSGMSQPLQYQGMWGARRSSSESERINSRLPPARRNSRAAELPRALVDAAPGTHASVPRRPSDGESRHAAYPGPPPVHGQRTLAYCAQERFAPRSPPPRSEMAPPSRASGSPSTAQLRRLRTVSGDGSSLSASGLPASAATVPREAAWAYHRKLSAPGDTRQPFPPRRSVDDVDAAQRTAQRARTQHVGASPAGADSKRHILPPLPPDLIAGNAASTTRSTLPPLRPPPGFHAHSYHVSEPHARATQPPGPGMKIRRPLTAEDLNHGPPGPSATRSAPALAAPALPAHRRSPSSASAPLSQQVAERAGHRLPSGTSASLNMHEQSFPSYTYDHEMEDVYGDDVGQPTPSASAGPSRPNLQHIVDVRRRGGTSAQQTRRMNHLISEQRRRESINAGFEELRKVLPNCREGGESKATILRRAIDHIGNLHELVHRQQLAHREQTTRGEGPGSRSRSPSDPPRGPGRHERVGSQPSNASGSQASMSNAGPSANVLSIHTNMHSGPIVRGPSDCSVEASPADTVTTAYTPLGSSQMTSTSSTASSLPWSTNASPIMPKLQCLTMRSASRGVTDPSPLSAGNAPHRFFAPSPRSSLAPLNVGGGVAAQRRSPLIQRNTALPELRSDQGQRLAGDATSTHRKGFAAPKEEDGSLEGKPHALSESDLHERHTCSELRVEHGEEQANGDAGSSDSSWISVSPVEVEVKLDRSERKRPAPLSADARRSSDWEAHAHPSKRRHKFGHAGSPAASSLPNTPTSATFVPRSMVQV
ncbi:hypothetical protein IE81DRAFT_350569 [Ceraceosorus guamensis]|uniref:BHLH domain-containing protein n=1 Tax=Ceraceosorus guamensis TaxID=1522189 RepID=A0A316VNV1_9BASI|nr:hypothetical protein IE81DRAFT_350569 [Ceraceosorus guamensis]PWN39000.1 hypothetical protein IE81DRAFT_350569 [Ceraceosorus guamensis]